MMGCSAPPVSPEMDAYLASRASRGEFSGSALVARGGQVMLSKGYAMSEVSEAAGNTPRTRFMIGSVTKQFTATAILLLQERGQLRVEESVCQYLTTCPVTWQPITLHQLLNHTAGLPDWVVTAVRNPSEPIPPTLDGVIASVASQPLRFPPGTQFEYSNSNYFVLGRIVEQVSRQSYAEFLDQQVFRELDMTDTGLAADDGDVPGRATGYTRSVRGGWTPASTEAWARPSLALSAGGLYSTVEDLYRWESGLTGGKVLRADSLAAMFRPNQWQYGFGWFIQDRDDMARRRGDGWVALSIQHGGGYPGFSAFVGRDPRTDVYVVLLSNHDWRTPDVPLSDIASALAQYAKP